MNDMNREEMSRYVWITNWINISSEFSKNLVHGALYPNHQLYTFSVSKTLESQLFLGVLLIYRDTRWGYVYCVKVSVLQLLLGVLLIYPGEDMMRCWVYFV